ncbi:MULTISPECIES: hypothetical protein [unclassified Ruegeria]|uniref:hypothetical protein n=1 Tax=unclassified Ruegeria TaxID=2625375 RepID=UPI00148986CD|nr:MULTISPECIES: hypothetical protein [unclassified Ruegeria]
MAPRKQRSDSIAGMREELAQPHAEDIAVPDLPGAEMLDAFGRECLARLYRENAEHWTEADLLMLVEAAAIQQQMHANRFVVMTTPPTIQHANGTIGKNPAHVYQFELIRALQTLLRDLGIRSKDVLNDRQKSPLDGKKRQPHRKTIGAKPIETHDDGSPNWESLRIN